MAQSHWQTSVVSILALAAGARGEVWYVDAAAQSCHGSGALGDPFCAIPQAIAAAAPGDVVRVAPGTYRGPIDFAGKAITVESESGPALTTLDGLKRASCVTFAAGEGPGSVLRGFTLVDGLGVLLLADPGGYEVRAGLAVYCKGTSPRIVGNVMQRHFEGSAIYSVGGAPRIEGNTIRGGGFADRGGGIFCVGGSPVIADNAISGHDASHGAGICVDGALAPEIAHNEVFDNGTVFVGYQSGPGAGIFAGGSSAVRIHHNVLRGNAGSSGAGLTLEACSGAVEDNRFEDNGAEFEGGGLALWNCADLAVRRNAFVGCTAGAGAAWFCLGSSALRFEDCTVKGSSGAPEHGAVEVHGSGHRLVRCRVTETALPAFHQGNAAVLDGAGLGLEDCLFAQNRSGIRVIGDVTVVRSTIADHLYDGFEVLHGELDMASCILSGNGQVAGGQLYLEGPDATATVVDSLVSGGYPGSGVIDADPRFVDAAHLDYRIAADSPCVDAGSAADLGCGLDLGTLPRRVSGHLTLAARVDQGAHEFSHVALAAERTAPGTFVLTSTGTAGLPTLLFAAAAPGSTCAGPAGVLLFDVAAPWVVLPWAPLPSAVTVAVPTDPAAASLVLQQAALGALPGAANLSGAAVLESP